MDGIYDFSTGQNSIGTFTSWYVASTSTPAQLPQLVGSVPAFDPLDVRIHLLWWDPTSKGYTATLDYTVNAYSNGNYIPIRFNSSYC